MRKITAKMMDAIESRLSSCGLRRRFLLYLRSPRCGGRRSNSSGSMLHLSRTPPRFVLSRKSNPPVVVVRNSANHYRT